MDRFIVYFPMNFDLCAPCTSADILRLEMLNKTENDANFLVAYFSVEGNTRLVRVKFPHVDILRVIDDFHIPLEEVGMKVMGVIPSHFAYRVEGSPFWEAQRYDFEVRLPGSQHYQFVTGGNCLDVISRDEPDISWVSSAHE